jgi:hypothetical protein
MEPSNPYSPLQELLPEASAARWAVSPAVLFCAAFYTLAALSGGRST